MQEAVHTVLTAAAAPVPTAGVETVASASTSIAAAATTTTATSSTSASASSTSSAAAAPDSHAIEDALRRDTIATMLDLPHGVHNVTPLREFPLDSIPLIRRVNGESAYG